MSEITESFTAWLAAHGIPEWLIPFLVSILPLVELRGGIIAARLLNMTLWKAIWVCIIGNILPIPFILMFVDKFFAWVKKHKIPGLTKFVLYLENKSLNKSDKMEKGEFIFLMLFVGIPLPGTGAWTGTLAASLLDMNFKQTVLAVMAGVLMAGIIMGLASAGIFGAAGAIAA